MPALEARLAILEQGVGRHGDDPRTARGGPALARYAASPRVRRAPASARPSAPRRRAAARSPRSPRGRSPPHPRRGRASRAGAAPASGSRRCPPPPGCEAALPAPARRSPWPCSGSKPSPQTFRRARQQGAVQQRRLDGLRELSGELGRAHESPVVRPSERQQNEREVRAGRRAAYRAGQRQTVEPRHPQVQQRHVEALAPSDQLQRLRRHRRRLGQHPPRLGLSLQDLQARRVVVDDQHALARRERAWSPARCGRGAPAARARIVKWNVEPFAGPRFRPRSFHPSARPGACEIARPSPVPP